jgi:hypothetical protein
MTDIDRSEQLQSVIDSDLLFRRNSINLHISRRGSVKTFNATKELIKLSALPGRDGFNFFIYITDEKNDGTVNELLNLIKLKIKVVSYFDACNLITDLVEGKNAYIETLKKGLIYCVTDKCREDLLKYLTLITGVT